jgi:hypothetical protein
MFEKVASDFSLDNVIDLTYLDTLPVVMHTYGKTTIIPEEFCWMSYRSHTSGEISFTRHTNKFVPKFTNYVASFLANIIDVPILPERVHFLRTCGRVTPHVDEAGRKCCLNIGLKNSSSAITRIYSNGAINDFVCEDGSVYLLNTSIMHSVEGSDNISRLLITYGFGSTFDVIKSRLKNVIQTI